jgi:hypothetical protein
VANYKCGKNQTQAKQLVAAKVWLGKLWLETKQALIFSYPPRSLFFIVRCKRIGVKINSALLFIIK